MQNEKLLNFIKNNIGRDFTEYDALGCADTVNKVLKEALGYEAGGGPSTYKMYTELLKNKNFKKVTLYEALAGDIVLSPTGFGNGTIKNGHVGFLGDNGVIYSNNSATSKLDDHLTADKWREYFKVQGGYPVHYFRAIGKSSVIPKIIQSSQDQAKVSLTVKGAIGFILVYVAQHFGIVISPEDVKLITDNAMLATPIFVTIYGILRKYV